MNCYCCSGNQYSKCCQPILTKEKTAKFPIELMRSRFTAYALGNFRYVVDTYATIVRKTLNENDIASDASGTKWIKLEIHTHSEDNEEPGFVEFSAFYLVKDQLFEMRENSRFIKENESWFYLDGDIIKNQKIAKLKRNDPCPCESGKKYKQCCQKTNRIF